MDTEQSKVGDEVNAKHFQVLIPVLAEAAHLGKSWKGTPFLPKPFVLGLCHLYPKES